MNYFEIKNQDTIMLGEAQINAAIKSLEDHKNDTIDIFLNKGVIKQNASSVPASYLYFEIISYDICQLQYYLFVEGLLTHIFTVNLDLSKKTGHTKIKYINDMFNNDQTTNFIKMQTAIFLGTFYYIEELISKQKTTVRQVKQIGKNNSVIAKKQTRKIINIKSEKFIYVLNLEDDSYKKMKEHRKRKYSGSWSVKGHYRHYKSGKISYVSPYIKGTGEFKSKTYIPQ